MYACDTYNNSNSNTPRLFFTVWDRPFPIRKTIYQQVLKLGANEASDQGLQNGI